jgi:hypothetical protein
MGFKRAEKHFRLVFADEEYEGLEVTAKSLSIGEYLNLSSVGTNPSQADVMKMYELLAKSIVEWNYEDDKGKPIKPTLENIKREEVGFINGILVAWMEAMAGVDPKLRKESNTGFDLESMPMGRL